MLRKLLPSTWSVHFFIFLKCNSKELVEKTQTQISFQSVSRQHAVINVLNNKEFMLMDLDTPNKTRLMGVSICGDFEII